METKKSPFEVLNAIDCTKRVEKKQGLTYLSWAWAWAEVKKAYPNAFYTIYENSEGFPYFTDGRTAWVKTGVTIEELEHIEYLPIMNDSAHASLPLASVTSWHVNKAIQRSLTKACARHGLGLYIYAGEDLPESVEGTAPSARSRAGNAKKTASPAKSAPSPAPAETPIPEDLSFHPLDKEIYWKYVACCAEDIPMKSGCDAKRAYIKTTHAGDAEVEAFMKDVQDYKAGLADGSIKSIKSNQ